MTQTRWTPGPWASLPSGAAYKLNARGVNRFYVGVQPGFDDDNERISMEEMRANAQLISAAPLMYETLELMAETFIGGGHVSDHDYALAISTAEEALRTARGETQENT